MKSLLNIFLLVVFMTSINLYAQMPPLIDREIFFGDPEISGAQISPDGKYISFIKPFNNIMNIWVKERNQKFEEAKPLTADSLRPVTGYFWSRDSKYILYVQDKGGDENYRIYAVNPADDGDPVPDSRDLTPFENVRAVIYSVPLKTPDEIIIGLNDRDASLHDVYRLKLSSGEKSLVWTNDDNVVGWSFDLEGQLKLGIRMTSDGGSEILKVDGDSLVQIYSVSNEEQASPYRFTGDGKAFYMVTNKGDIDKTELVLFNLETGNTELIEKDPLDEVDIDDVMFSDKTDEILATFYTGAKRRIYPKEEKFAADYKKLQELLPDGDIHLRSWDNEENLVIVSVQSDIDPGSVYLYDRIKGEIELLYKSRPELPSEHLAEMQPVTYEARDGLSIPAYLTVPKGVKPENLPTVIFVHGGPWGRDYWGYNSVAQFLANRGYVVLMPNFRASTGYGKKFLNAGNKQWGTGSMQHDISDAVKYLTDKGISDPKKIAIAGGSYGGYATLAGLAFTPDLYAAGFDIVGPSNIITLLNSIPPYWAPMKKIFSVRVGDMDNPAEKKMLEEQSPLFSAKNIKAPLYVVQGANDPRVKQAEADQIVAALRDLGRKVEYMIAPDEGHGFRGKENRLAMFYAMEKFFAEQLGGRYQEELKPEIREKLASLVVDINTVKLPETKIPEGAAVLLTKFDGSKIVPASAKYKVKINAQGQNIELSLKREINKLQLNGKDIIRITDIAEGAMTASDSLDLDAETLLPISRSAKQGGGEVIIKFKPEAVEGKMSMGGQEMPINVKLDTPVLSDGTNVDLAVCSLHLEEKYSAEFMQFDVRFAQVKKMHLNVAGNEKVSTVKGESDSYKVELTTDGSDSKTTYWIDKSSRQILKKEDKLGSQMGGAVVLVVLSE